MTIKSFVTFVQSNPENLHYETVASNRPNNDTLDILDILVEHQVPPIGPDELPPAYTQSSQNGAPMVTCRVCQAMIDITEKRDQHVVKCSQCLEATVRLNFVEGSEVYLFCACFSRSAMRRRARNTCDVRATAC